MDMDMVDMDMKDMDMVGMDMVGMDMVDMDMVDMDMADMDMVDMDMVDMDMVDMGWDQGVQVLTTYCHLKKKLLLAVFDQVMDCADGSDEVVSPHQHPINNFFSRLAAKR